MGTIAPTCPPKGLDAIALSIPVFFLLIGMALWAVAQFLLGLGAAIAVIFLGPRLSGAQQAAVGLFAVWSPVAAGAAFDRRRWLIAAEPLRRAGAALAAGFLAASRRRIVRSRGSTAWGAGQ